MSNRPELEHSKILKLVALDQADLEIISAHCQDAVLRLDDMTYLAKTRTFALFINRFDWETALEQQAGDKSSKPLPLNRRRTALRFECVGAVKHLNIDRSKKDDVKKLLALRFDASNPPSGTISLIFSGGSEIKLEVECIEAAMQDLGAAWATKRQPHHQLDEKDQA